MRYLRNIQRARFAYEVHNGPEALVHYESLREEDLVRAGTAPRGR